MSDVDRDAKCLCAEKTSQTAWLERGGNQLETRRLDTYCRGKCCIPSLEEIRDERRDPGGPVLIEGTADDFSTTISSDKMTDELDESELPSYATSMHNSTPSPSPIPNLSTSNQSLSIMHEMALTHANDDPRNCMSRAIRESG